MRVTVFNTRSTHCDEFSNSRIFPSIILLITVSKSTQSGLGEDVTLLSRFLSASGASRRTKNVLKESSLPRMKGTPKEWKQFNINIYLDAQGNSAHQGFWPEQEPNRVLCFRNWRCSDLRSDMWLQFSGCLRLPTDPLEEDDHEWADKFALFRQSSIRTTQKLMLHLMKKIMANSSWWSIRLDWIVHGARPEKIWQLGLRQFQIFLI